METRHSAPATHRIQSASSVILALTCVLFPWIVAAQGLTGALVGTVKDEQGGVLQGALVRVESPALIGGPVTVRTNEKGQLRFPVLLPGVYELHIELPGFSPWHETGIQVGAGATVERTVILKLADRGIGRRPGLRIAHRRAAQRVRNAHWA